MLIVLCWVQHKEDQYSTQQAWDRKIRVARAVTFMLLLQSLTDFSGKNFADNTNRILMTFLKIWCSSAFLYKITNIILNISTVLLEPVAEHRILQEYEQNSKKQLKLVLDQTIH